MTGNTAVIVGSERPKTNTAEGYGQERGSDSEQNPWQLKLSDALIAYFTYCLVIVGWATMRSGERNVRDLERALVFVEGVSDGLPGNEGQGIGDIKFTVPLVPTADPPPKENRAGYASVIFKNYGRTPAVITAIYGELAYSPHIREPKQATRHLSLPVGFMIDAGKPSMPFRETLIIGTADFNNARFVTGAIFLVGKLEYRDAFGELHTTAYCWKYQFPSGEHAAAFYIADLPELNYFT